jgi:putative hydrolase of the HAD superfamily
LIHAILFDFGNVIAFFDHYRAIGRFETRTNLASDVMFRAIYQGELEHEFESGRLTPERFVTEVIDRIGYQHCADRFVGEFVDIFTPNPSVLELIPRLKPRYKIVLASNTNALHSAHFKVQYADALRHFDALGMSFQAGVRKPEAGFYHYCATLLNTPASECLFIDDIEKNVAGAKAVGMSTILYSPEIDLVARLAEHGVELA